MSKESYYSGTQYRPTDTERVLLVKILNRLAELGYTIKQPNPVMPRHSLYKAILDALNA